MWNNILPGWRVARYSLPVSDAKEKEKKRGGKKVKEKNLAWLASWHGTASTSQTRWLEDIAGEDMSRFKS